MVTDETNGIRLVGGEFYGCVELYDDVTQQWGPVRGWDPVILEGSGLKMALADLACRNLGFSGVLATAAYRLSNGTIFRTRWNTVDFYYLNSKYYYMDILPTYPSSAPKFVLPEPEDINTPDSYSLHDAVDRIVRGPCGSRDYKCINSYYSMCLACAGQRTTAVSDLVTCTSNYIRVSFPRPPDNSVQLYIHLAAPPCSANQNSTHIYIDAPLTACGTTRQDTEDDIIYRNTLTIYVNTSAIITRHRLAKIGVECHLPRRKTVTVKLDPQNSSVFRSHIVGRGTGEFIISMELYLSNNFRSSVLVYPLSAEVGQMLYVQLKVTSGDSNLQLFVDSCMATPTEQPDDSNVLYHLIRDGLVSL
ncbi:PREDICTED: deleted in malignant brain tumors 1 protein-like [Branchiostoma belcheri]|uniref:Deleted in malignant brain tumors 1 protein-like n=1 Tax=Branchiostoma belcheri TaxID=7741 RepID=A0A6P4Z7Q7_BRABE|nr:PREDICTED: deleted in malignant brain tumors 1 protein-like [Branchiostoma belcheri]